MIAKVVGQYFLPLLIITILFAILLVVIIATKLVSADTTEKMALAASVQVGFGMVIGYVCVYIGLMMTWFGIEASYEVDVKGEAAIGGLSLKSASPGLLFALGGMILIAVCLYKPIVYEAKTPFRKYPTNPPDQGSSQSKNDASNEEGKTSDPEITPNPPPGYKTTE